MSDAYRAASTWACDWFEHFVVNGDIDLPDISFPVAILMQAQGFCFRVHQRPFLMVAESAGAEIAARAWESPDVHEFCCWVCADNIDANFPLVPSLKAFLLEVLVGTPAPKRGRGRPSRRWLHRAMLYEGALVLRERFGLGLTRNEVSPPLSASDAIAEALTVCGRPTRFEEVAALCTHHDHGQFRAEYSMYAGARASRIEFNGLVDRLLRHGEAATTSDPSVRA